MLAARLGMTAAAALLLCGCGTSANLHGQRLAFLSTPDEYRPRIFGGVANDFGWTGSVAWWSKPIFVLDFPVSLVADIVTIPEVREKQAQWDKRHETEEVEPSRPEDTSIRQSPPTMGVDPRTLPDG